MKKRTVILTAILICLTSSLSARGAQRHIEKSFNINAGGTLTLDTDLGTVEISTHPENTVQVNVDVVVDSSNSRKDKEMLDDMKLTFNNSGTELTVRGRLNQAWSWRSNRLRARFQIKVPDKFNLNVNTAGGHLSVSHITGRLNLHTSGGRIMLGNISGDVKAATSGGSIKIGEVNGNLDVRTSGGRIDIEGVMGNLNAHTSGGSIEARLLQQTSKPVKLSTSGGNIRLAVPADFKADLEASTSGGSIYTDFPVVVTGRVSTSSLHGPINGGGPPVELHTSGGNIEIAKGAR